MTTYSRELELKLFIDGKEELPGEKGAIPNANGTNVLSLTCDKQLDKPDMLSFTVTMLERNEFVVLDKIKFGVPVKVVAGYEAPETLFEGEVCYVNPKFQAGKSIVEVVCYSKLWRLTVGNTNSRAVGDGHQSNVSSSSVFSTVVGDAGAHKGASDGLSVASGSQSIKFEYVSQVGLNDFQFLQQLAGGAGFAMRGGSSPSEIQLKPIETSGSAKLTVHRDREDAGATDVLATRADFTNSIVRQVAEVWVRGYDHLKRKGFVGKANKPSSVLGGDSGIDQTGKALYNAAGKGKIIQVLDAPVASEDEAKGVAQALLDRFSSKWMTGRVSMYARPEMAPGDIVDMKDFGVRFSGKYLVTGVQHLWNGGGSSPMVTHLTVERNGSPTP
jgi:phage protein D